MIVRRLRDIRTGAGMSQETLAELVDVSRQTISKWENGAAHPSSDNLAALSRVFNLPAEAFVSEDWTPPEPQVVEVPVEVRVEVPVEVKVEVPVEVPVPRPRNYRLTALLAALVLAVGIAIGALLFRERPKNVIPVSELQVEEIDPSTPICWIDPTPVMPEVPVIPTPVPPDQ